MPRAKRKGNAIPELIELPPVACKYMREELACEHPLAQAISDLPLESGRVQVFAMDNTLVEELLELRGNPVPYPSVEELRASWRSFEDFTANYLHRGGSRVFLMENPTPSANISFLTFNVCP